MRAIFMFLGALSAVLLVSFLASWALGWFIANGHIDDEQGGAR